MSSARIEYRVCWSASTNITFHGEGDWTEWDGDEDNVEGDVQDALTIGHGALSQGLEEALDASGFNWWIETRVGE